MSWIFYGLIAPALYAMTNFVDKYVIVNAIKDYKGMIGFGTIMGFVGGTLLWLLTGMPTMSAFDTGIIMFSGALLAWNSILYYKLVAAEDVSKVALLFQVTPIFVLILSWFFLNEPISLTQFLGFFIILFSAVGLTAVKIRGVFQIGQTFWLGMAINLIVAVSAILAKFTINANSFSAILSFESWGFAIGGILLLIIFKQIRDPFIECIRTIPKTTMGVMFFSETIYITAKSATFFAYSLGPIALVSVLSSTQGLFGIAFGIILTLLVPNYIKEDLSLKNLLNKVLWGLLIVLGVLLIGK